MNPIQRQTVDAALATGRVHELFDEMFRQIDVLLDRPVPEPVAVDAVPRLEHERIVSKLNDRIVALNVEIDRLRERKAS